MCLEVNAGDRLAMWRGSATIPFESAALLRLSLRASFTAHKRSGATKAIKCSSVQEEVDPRVS